MKNKAPDFSHTANVAPAAAAIHDLKDLHGGLTDATNGLRKLQADKMKAAFLPGPAPRMIENAEAASRAIIAQGIGQRELARRMLDEVSEGCLRAGLRDVPADKL
jgi:hypothetical protein